MKLSACLCFKKKKVKRLTFVAAYSHCAALGVQSLK